MMEPTPRVHTASDVSGVDDLFGAWQTPEGAMSFAVADGAGEQAQSAWQLALPAAVEDAQAILAARQVELARAENNLARAQARLDALVASVSVQAQGQAGVSFAAPGSAESDLLGALNTVQALERVSLEDVQSGAVVSFGLFGRQEPGEPQDAMAQWQDLLRRVRDMVSNYAQIKTSLGGTCLGCTSVGWSGDFSTLWENDAPIEAMRVHQTNVRLALASRLALMRLVMVVGTGAAGLVARLTIPGAQLLLLPYVWKFVRDVLKELKNVRG